jgi:hypothetical protein
MHAKVEGGYVKLFMRGRATGVYVFDGPLEGKEFWNSAERNRLSCASLLSRDKAIAASPETLKLCRRILLFRRMERFFRQRRHHKQYRDEPYFSQK